MPNNINIIVLCAGKSSRMGLNIPKVALTINGVSLIENTLKNLQKLIKSIEMQILDQSSTMQFFFLL